MEIAVTARGLLPVLVRVAVWTLLVVPNTWSAKERDGGVTAAAVTVVPAVNSGVCQIPRP
jgi:hypothetical protein